MIDVVVAVVYCAIFLYVNWRAGKDLEESIKARREGSDAYRQANVQLRLAREILDQADMMFKATAEMTGQQPPVTLTDRSTYLKEQVDTHGEHHHGDAG